MVGDATPDATAPTGNTADGSNPDSQTGNGQGGGSQPVGGGEQGDDPQNTSSEMEANGDDMGMPSPATSGAFELTIAQGEIPTVGIATWSTTETIDSAVIQFGREEGNPEYEAPVNLDDPTTLLLGMKPDTTYYVQIIAQGGGQTYASDVVPFETGFLPNGLPVVTVNDVDASSIYGGFTILCTGISGPGTGGGGGFGGFGGGAGGGAGGDSYVFVFDRDGDHVWAYDLSDTPVSGCSRARMSYDGKHMWVGNFSNVSPDGALMRITMDGQTDSTADVFSFPGRHHDFAVLPNNNVLFYEQENGGGYTDGHEGPDIISELDVTTGTATQLYHQMDDFQVPIEESNGAHTNQINYVPELDAMSISLRHSNTIGLLSYPDAELLAIFGGPISHFEGMEWDAQHGHHVQDGSILIFNNNGSNGGSSILEYSFDIAGQSFDLTLDYSAGVSSGAFGDVKRLPNGNIFVTYSTSGVIHETDASGNLLREITTTTVGYAEHRKTLYGLPPPFDY